MQTLSANNPDGNGPYSEQGNRPTKEDPDPHNPPLKVLGPKEATRIDVQGGAVNREDPSAVDAAQGELRSTPQGP